MSECAPICPPFSGNRHQYLPALAGDSFLYGVLLDKQAEAVMFS